MVEITDNEIKNKAKETSGGNYYYEQGFIYGFELGEENGRKEKIEKLKTEIESLRQKTVSRRETINGLNARLKSRLEQVERLKGENKELKKENAELKADKEWLDNTNNEQTKIILELQAQIEKLKCCGNCKNFKFVGESLKGTYQCLKDGDMGKYYRSCDNFEKWEMR